MNLTLPIDDTFEPDHASSPTDRVIYEMQVYGYRPFQDEPDPRPLPEEPMVQSALTAMFSAMFEMLGDTRLEPDLEDLLWSTVNLFHRALLSVSSANFSAMRTPSAPASASRTALR